MVVVINVTAAQLAQFIGETNDLGSAPFLEFIEHFNFVYVLAVFSEYVPVLALETELTAVPI